MINRHASARPVAGRVRRGLARRPAAVCLAVLSLGLPPALAQEEGADTEDFIERFAGVWTGEGEVLRNEDGSTRKVSCRVENTRQQNTSSTDGECRAMVIFRRDISSEITFGPDGSATGIYEGAETGPATLDGRLDGDVLELEMTYAKPVFGDDKAVMKITNPADGTYSVAVFDHVDDPEELTQVSIVEFRRQD